MSDYHPVSCELHSRYELLAIEQRTVLLRLKEKDKQLTGVIRDVYSRERVEYLQLQTSAGKLQEIRLDGIDTVTRED
ncbi:MAG: Rho-binding antiterminator [Sedimenticola sp.]